MQQGPWGACGGAARKSQACIPAAGTAPGTSPASGAGGSRKGLGLPWRPLSETEKVLPLTATLMFGVVVVWCFFFL